MKQSDMDEEQIDYYKRSNMTFESMPTDYRKGRIMNTHRHRNAWIIWLGVIIACGVAGWYIGATYDLSGGLQ